MTDVVKSGTILVQYQLVMGHVNQTCPVFIKKKLSFSAIYITFNLPSFLLSSSDTFGHFSSYVVPALNACLNAFNEEVKIKSLS